MRHQSSHHHLKPVVEYARSVGLERLESRSARGDRSEHTDTVNVGVVDLEKLEVRQPPDAGKDALMRWHGCGRRLGARVEQFARVEVVERVRLLRRGRLDPRQARQVVANDLLSARVARLVAEGETAMECRVS